MVDFEGPFAEFSSGDMEFEFDGAEIDVPGELGSPFNEAQEMELAAELLEVTDEAELDQFLESLIKKAGRAVGGFVRSPVGKALGGVLKGVAKKALPVVGGAVGGYFGGPAGARVGSQLASGAGRIFGLELEGLSQEDQEFETARRFVRFAGTAAKKAALAPSAAKPQTVAQKATEAAARKHAPGLLRRKGSALPGSSPVTSTRAGRWYRRGRTIVIVIC